jgi:hypothetical protein
MIKLDMMSQIRHVSELDLRRADVTGSCDGDCVGLGETVAA